MHFALPPAPIVRQVPCDCVLDAVFSSLKCYFICFFPFFSYDQKHHFSHHQFSPPPRGRSNHPLHGSPNVALARHQGPVRHRLAVHRRPLHVPDLDDADFSAYVRCVFIRFFLWRQLDNHHARSILIHISLCTLCTSTLRNSDFAPSQTGFRRR